MLLILAILMIAASFIMVVVQLWPLRTYLRPRIKINWGEVIQIALMWGGLAILVFRYNFLCH